MVGYMGDGINDAPSLHAADVGISVSSAVDVARDAAEIILLKPGLAFCTMAFSKGRRAFGNVMKYLLMGTSSNFGNMFSMAGASLVPAVSADAADANPAEQFSVRPGADHHPHGQRRRHVPPASPPRWDMGSDPQLHALHRPDQLDLRLSHVLVLLSFFHASEAVFHTGWFVESLATQTLVLFVIRTTKNPFKSRPSLPLRLRQSDRDAGSLAPYSPLAKTLGFTTLPGSFYWFLALATGTYLVLVEIAKRALFSRADF